MWSLRLGVPKCQGSDFGFEVGIEKYSDACFGLWIQRFEDLKI